MGWFKKRLPEPGSLRIDLERHWKNAEGQLSGRPAFIRVNAGLEEIVGHPAYNHNVVVSIAFNDCRDDGMPSTEDELDVIDTIEDIFRDALQANQSRS